MAWLPAAEREQIFDQMVKNGVVAVRLSLTRPIDQSIDAVRLAHEKKLAVLLEVSLNNVDFYPEGTKPRSGRGRIWDMYRLSDIDQKRFQTAIGDALQKIDALVLSLPWNPATRSMGAYNGDLAILPNEKMKTARSLDEMEELPLVEKALRSTSNFCESCVRNWRKPDTAPRQRSYLRACPTSPSSMPIGAG